MYFKDFDSYSYGTFYGPNRIIPLDEVKMIGWLENGHDYPKGEVDEQTLYYLREIIVTQKSAERSHKGYHYCDFCESQSNNLDEHPKVKLGSQECSLGSAEFWLPSPTLSGQFYVMPNLIYHYIVDHGYRPPDEFLEAVYRFPFNLQWNASETRQQLVEKQRRRIRIEENKLLNLNEANPRIFTLQPNDHYEFHTGLSSENVQILASHYHDRFVIITFDAEGNLTQVIDRPQAEIVESEEAELQSLFKEHGFVISPIQVKSFLLVDYAIGVNPLPEDLEYFTRHPEEFSEKEKAEKEDEIAQWLYFEKFEFLWLNDFWCDSDGYITDS